MGYFCSAVGACLLPVHRKTRGGLGIHGCGVTCCYVGCTQTGLESSAGSLRAVGLLWLRLLSQLPPPPDVRFIVSRTPSVSVTLCPPFHLVPVHFPPGSPSTMSILNDVLSAYQPAAINRPLFCINCFEASVRPLLCTVHRPLTLVHHISSTIHHALFNSFTEYPEVDGPFNHVQ